MHGVRKNFYSGGKSGEEQEVGTRSEEIGYEERMRVREEEMRKVLSWPFVGHPPKADRGL